MGGDRALSSPPCQCKATLASAKAFLYAASVMILVKRIACAARVSRRTLSHADLLKTMTDAFDVSEPYYYAASAYCFCYDGSFL